jgi:hypothetical protein
VIVCSLIPSNLNRSDDSAAPIIPAEQWGRPYLSGTPPLLTHLSRLLSLSISPHLSSHLLSEDSADNPGSEGESIGSRVYRGPMVDDGAELGEPSLVISVESDAVDFGWDNWVCLPRPISASTPSDASN